MDDDGEKGVVEDELLLGNIVDLLKSEDEVSIISTCEFLQTVVIYDFPADAFLNQRTLVQSLLKLCEDANHDVAKAACSCVDFICRRIVSAVKQQADPNHIAIGKLIAEDDSTRNAGDGVEGEILVQSNLAIMIAKACHQMILTSDKTFDHILKLLIVASELSLSSRTPRSENLEFLQVLASISVALRAASRRNFATFVLLLVRVVGNFQITALSNDVIYEIFNGLLDASIIHFHPEILPTGLSVLQENLTLNDQYERACQLFQAFRNLAKFLKSSSKDDDLLPVVSLLQLDDRLAQSLLPSVFQHLKVHGGKPAVTLTLLLLSQEEPIPEQVYHYLTELASPLKSRTIGPHVAELLVDYDVVRAITNGMLSGNDRIAPNAEKVLTLVVKGRPWMNDEQWKTLMDIAVPKMILDIGPKLSRLKMLGPILWDLIQQSIILPSDSSYSSQLDLGFVLRFLVRNLTGDPLQRDKSSLGLVSALCQQPQAGQLVPRISAIDPLALSAAFQGDLSLQLKSTAKFDDTTLMETVDCLRSADLVHARTYLIKLSIILEDTGLHPYFLMADGLALLTDFLTRALLAGDTEPYITIMSSALKGLLYLASFDPTVKKTLGTDIAVILNSLRVTILTRNDIIVRRHCVTFLQLLAQEEDPSPRRTIEALGAAEVSAKWSDLWSKAVIRWSAKFVFNAELSTPPLIESVPSFLQMTGSELELGMMANDCALTGQALAHMASAKGHEDVEESLSILQEVLQRSGLPLKEILSLPWQEALDPFFGVLPESAKDEEVFVSILETLLLAFRQLRRVDADELQDLPFFRWLQGLVTDEKRTFWTLFRDQCQHGSCGERRLWPVILRFVAAAVRLMMSCPSGPLNHILRLLCRTFELENPPQVYQLNSLKLILDCLVQSTGAVMAWRPDSVDQSLVSSLLRHATATVVSFSSSPTHSNKGRSVVQACAQLTDLLVSLSRQSGGSHCTPLPELDWLMLLLQHPDSAVKTAGLRTCAQISRDVHISDEVADVVLSFLFDPGECCSAVEQAALLLSQHPRRLTDQAVRQACMMVSSVRIRANQALLAALYHLLINGCLYVQANPSWLAAVANEVVPTVPAVLTSTETWRLVKAEGLCLLYRTALLRPKVLSWLLQQSDCTSAAIDGLLQTESGALVGESALYLSFLLQSEATSEPSKIFQAVLQSIPRLWDVFRFLEGRTLNDPAAREVLLFLQTFLVIAWMADADGAGPLQQIDSAPPVESFSRWLLANLPVKTDSTLRQSALQVLGVLLLCHPSPSPETIKSLSDFIVKELQLSLHNRGSDKSLTALIRLAHNFILRHPDAERELLQRGALNPLIEIWKSRSSSPSVVRCLINFEKILVGRETNREVRILLRLIMDFLEEKEAVVIRQTVPMGDEDWELIESIHELLLASVPSLECRRMISKYKAWSSLPTTWHPVHLKRIINRQQHWALASLNALRSRLLSALTMHAEPTLPDLLESAAVGTLVDMVGTDRNALSILRNMAFHNSYKTVLLTTSSVLPLFVRLLTSGNHSEEEALSAVSALVSLASNNQRVKSDVRSMTDAWFQRNPIILQPARNDASRFVELCLALHKLTDV